MEEKIKRRWPFLFPMVDFVGYGPQFKMGWRGDESRRRKLLEDLLETIRAYTGRWFANIVENENFTTTVSKPNRERYYYNAFSLAARTCMHSVDNWAMRERINHVHFVFEDGDFGRGEILKQLDKFSHFPLPDLRPSHDQNKTGRTIPGFSPLQASDLLAYAIRAACGKGKTVGYYPDWVIEQFTHMLYEPIGVWNKPSLKEFENKLLMFERLKLWPPETQPRKIY